MEIVKKRKKTRKFKQNTERFLMWIFMFIGMLVVLGWSLNVFREAGNYWLEPKKIVIESVGAVGTPVAHAETLESGSKLTEEGASKTPSSTEALIKKYFGDEYELALAVAKCESQLDPSRIGDTHLSKPSIGLFQINQIWHPYTTEQLQDAEQNIKIAKEIRDKGGWDRWTCYSKGYYEKYL